jgi:hypothetical protein
LLSVIAIIGVVAAFIFPVIAHAKRNGIQTTSLSNLRQCGVALLIYCDEYGGLEQLPKRPSADEVLRLAPTCDPGDYFRTSCSESPAAPFIGSYAYVRDDELFGPDERWRHYLGIHQESPYSPAILANIFVSSKRHIPSLWFGPYPNPNPLPDRIQLFESDGGARLYKPKSRPDIGYTWHTLFLKR